MSRSNNTQPRYAGWRARKYAVVRTFAPHHMPPSRHNQAPAARNERPEPEKERGAEVDSPHTTHANFGDLSQTFDARRRRQAERAKCRRVEQPVAERVGGTRARPVRSSFLDRGKVSRVERVDRRDSDQVRSDSDARERRQARRSLRGAWACLSRQCFCASKRAA